MLTDALRQKKVLKRRRWATRDQLHDAIVCWIERSYNRRRHQRARAKPTPVDLELALTARAAAVAAWIAAHLVSTDPVPVPLFIASDRPAVGRAADARPTAGVGQLTGTSCQFCP